MIIELEYYLGYIYWGILAFAILSSLIIFSNKSEPLYLKLFTPFLFLTLAVEVAGFTLNLKHISNLPLYNFFIVIEFVFYFFVLKCVIRNLAIKKIITIAIGSYPILALIDIF